MSLRPIHEVVMKLGSIGETRNVSELKGTKLAETISAQGDGQLVRAAQIEIKLGR